LHASISISSTIQLPSSQNYKWVLHGKTIDITGSGILIVLLEQPPNEDQVSLKISLPTEPPECIRILAHPVRTLRVDDNEWNIAYRFDTISEEERDKIIGCCLVEQRRVLRLNHGIRGSVQREYLNN